MSEEQMSVGALLRAAREQKGWTVEQVVQQLKLARRQVEAMEGDDFAALPGNTFARGFVRNYARLLQLDPQPVLAQLEQQLPQEREQVAFPQASENPSNLCVEFRDANARASSWPVLAMMATGLLLGIAIVWWYVQQPAMPEIALEEPEVAASLPDAIAFEEVDAVASAVASAAQASLPASAPQKTASDASELVEAVPASRPARLVSSAVAARGVHIAVNQDSWVQIMDGHGQRVFSGILTAGAEQAWAASAPYQVKIGNAPGERLYYRGKPVDLAPFTRGDVATLELK